MEFSFHVLVLTGYFALFGTLLLIEINGTNTLIWINNNIHFEEMYVITHPCPTANGHFVKLPLKSGHECVVKSHLN